MGQLMESYSADHGIHLCATDEELIEAWSEYVYKDKLKDPQETGYEITILDQGLRIQTWGEEGGFDIRYKRKVAESFEAIENYAKVLGGQKHAVHKQKIAVAKEEREAIRKRTEEKRDRRELERLKEKYPNG